LLLVLFRVAELYLANKAVPVSVCLLDHSACTAPATAAEVIGSLNHIVCFKVANVSGSAIVVANASILSDKFSPPPLICACALLILAICGFGSSPSCIGVVHISWSKAACLDPTEAEYVDLSSCQSNLASEAVMDRAGADREA
jgi:hypothetical protein